MTQLPKKHYSHQDVTRALYWKKFGIEKICMDKDSLMPKKRKDFFVYRSIVISRKKLKRNQIICDYMGPIVLYIGYICDGK
jgi:hypothetical protein